jgi:hypothetical protein
LSPRQPLTGFDGDAFSSAAVIVKLWFSFLARKALIAVK